MEPPSSALLRTLTDLRLATGRDLQRCRARVRKLGRGLPAYDSLWIDALVHSGRLTPFQARKLEQRRAEELRVGPRLVLESVRHVDVVMSLFSARDTHSGERFLVSQAVTGERDGDPEGQVAAALEELFRRLAPLRDRLPFAPLSFHRPDEATGSEAEGTAGAAPAIPSLTPAQTPPPPSRYSILSPDTSGQSLGKLLVRRGRFPGEVVHAIGIELCRELAAAESSLSHGDLRPANVLLSDRGEVCLLNWGVLSSMRPAVTIHTPLPADACDGMAPERIGSGLPAAPLSDMYSLGCLLWQLLAGRSPCPMADPLGKLTAHRQRQIPDVRILATETSEPLARLIRLMTSREPHRRPQSFQDVLAALEERRLNPRRRLSRFVRTFESAAPRRPEMGKRSSARPIAASLLASSAMIGLAFLFWNQGDFGLPTPRTADATTLPPSDDPAAAPSPLPAPLPLPLPSPDPHGVVTLSGSERYRGGTVSTDGPLILRCETQTPATIVVNRESPLDLKGEHVTLENVSLVFEEMHASHGEPGSPVRIRAQELVIRRCSLQERGRPESPGNSPTIPDPREATAPPLRPAFLVWSLLDSADPESGRLLLADTLVETSSPSLSISAPLAAGLLENVYKRGGGELLHLRAGVRSGLKVPLLLNRCTLRQSGPLVRLTNLKNLSRQGRLSIQGEETLLDLLEGTALIELHGRDLPPQWDHHFEVSARGLIARAHLPVILFQNERTDESRALSSPRMTVDGMLSGEFHFAESGIPGERLEEVVIDSLPVRDSAQVPGADLRRLPPLKGRL